ncbi:unnamed protein product, partial [Ascophyllum nodosum]
MFPTTLIPRARLRGFRPICVRHRRSGARAAPRFIARSPSIPPRATVKSKDSWIITGGVPRGHDELHQRRLPSSPTTGAPAQPPVDHGRAS